MKQKHLQLSVLIMMFLSCLLCACKSGSQAKPPAPFSAMTWESTVDDILAAEGSSSSSYDSVYGGTTYSYAKEYNGKEGTIKYMFNEKDELMCLAWAYGSDDENDLYALYDEINQSVTEKYGESNYNANSNASNYGNVWYLESGDIILSTMVTADNKALQYAYLNPAVSNTEARTEAK